VGAALPVRAAALVAEAGEREEATSRIQAAFELERSLICGREGDTGAALGLAAWVEECVRTLLREAALGDLGTDLGAAADESLIAAGLQAGDGSGAEADEWDSFLEEEVADFTVTAQEQADASASERDDAADDSVTRLLEPIPQDTSEIRVTWLGDKARPGERRPEEGVDPVPVAEEAEAEADELDDGADWGFAEDDGEETDMRDRDWLSEVSREERATLEWPAAGEQPREHEPDREPIDSPRVRHLFPVPEDADWEVRELQYDRRRAGSGR
jgi:hypothetical protein